MAHLAQLDKNNIVVSVIVVDNLKLIENGTERETKAIQHVKSIFGHENFVQTSYNKTFRKNFAGVGYLYDQTRDAFIPPKPENIEGFEFIFNEKTCAWDLVKLELHENFKLRSKKTVSLNTTNINEKIFPAPKKGFWVKLKIWLRKVFNLKRK